MFAFIAHQPLNVFLTDLLAVYKRGVVVWGDWRLIKSPVSHVYSDVMATKPTQTTLRRLVGEQTRAKRHQ